MDPKEVATRVRQEIAAVVEADGAELVHVEFVREEGRWILRLYIDREGGVTMDDCARISYLVSPMLDVADPIESAYSLEVSSPGIERPLADEPDFERFAGERVKISTRNDHQGRRRFTGELAGVENGDVVVVVDGKTHKIPYGDIEKANLAPEFRDGNRPGKG